MADSLPWEIIVDILSRLPVNDLLRYRCVSKHWHFLINGPDFINLHLKHSLESNSNIATVLIHDYYKNLVCVDLNEYFRSATNLDHPIDECNWGFEVLGSCNGLLAILIHSNNIIILWNPSTRRYRELAGYFNDFSFYGFWHDSVNDDYKLVRITLYNGTDDSEVSIYSAKANAWERNKRVFFPYLLENYHRYSVLAGNALHWVVYRKPESGASELIVAFDLVTEEFHEIPQPDNYEDASSLVRMEIGVLGGLFCAIYSRFSIRFPGTLCHIVDVWVMKEHGVKESWTKLFSMEPPKEIGIRFSSVTPIAYMNCGDQVILHTYNGKFILYDLRRKRANEVIISGAPKQFRARSCARSLVGLDGDWDEVEENQLKKRWKKSEKRDLKAKKR